MSEAQAILLVVVEDEQDFRILIRAALGEDPRIEIRGEAADAASAIEVARSAGPGLIILDHYLDGKLSGLEAAPMLKEAVPEAKILLLTSYDLAAEARREPAIDAYLRKDEIDQLLPTAQRLLGLDPAA